VPFGAGCSSHAGSASTLHRPPPASASVARTADRRWDYGVTAVIHPQPGSRRAPPAAAQERLGGEAQRHHGASSDDRPGGRPQPKHRDRRRQRLEVGGGDHPQVVGQRRAPPRRSGRDRGPHRGEQAARLGAVSPRQSAGAHCRTRGRAGVGRADHPSIRGDVGASTRSAEGLHVHPHQHGSGTAGGSPARPGHQGPQRPGEASRLVTNRSAHNRRRGSRSRREST
jgi:hypothetical protein